MECFHVFAVSVVICCVGAVIVDVVGCCVVVDVVVVAGVMSTCVVATACRCTVAVAANWVAIVRGLVVMDCRIRRCRYLLVVLALLLLLLWLIIVTMMLLFILLLPFVVVIPMIDVVSGGCCVASVGTTEGLIYVGGVCFGVVYIMVVVIHGVLVSWICGGTSSCVYQHTQHQHRQHHI